MQDQELLRRFEDCTLAFPEWTHRAHVKVAFLYLRDLPLEAATEKLRSGIRRYNAAHNVPDGLQQGYNETTTVAFARLIAATMSAYGDVIPTPDAESFCEMHPQLLTKNVLRIFYSPRQRNRPEAKHQFVEPDLAPLPRILGLESS